jgi:hypothetical protein
MALTYSTTNIDVIGSRRQVTGSITFDSSYLTGGEVLTPSLIGLYQIEHMEVDPAQGYVPRWNRSQTAPTIQVFQGDNANAAAAPGIEVPNATNLATLVVGFRATGR